MVPNWNNGFDGDRRNPDTDRQHRRNTWRVEGVDDHGREELDKDHSHLHTIVDLTLMIMTDENKGVTGVEKRKAIDDINKRKTAGGRKRKKSVEGIKMGAIIVARVSPTAIVMIPNTKVSNVGYAMNEVKHT
ncbi:hypothetical protein MMC18_004527 [Xylographa bjoerkii]|nr:hypothetical protein [Xylographa bjoerkii]